MNYKELVREAMKLLDMYEPDKQCVDTFIENSAKNLMVYVDKYQSYFIVIICKNRMHPSFMSVKKAAYCVGHHFSDLLLG